MSHTPTGYEAYGLSSKGFDMILLAIAQASKEEMEMDWQINKSILDCNKYLLENKMNCDVKFKVGEDQEIIEAQKSILSTRSPVFDRMFNGSFKESEIDPVIPDVRPAAFKALLRYCYYECLDIECDVALSLLYAATKYMLPILEREASKTLMEKLNSSNLLDVFEYAVMARHKELQGYCRNNFQENLSETNILDVTRYVATTEYKDLHAICRHYLKEHLSGSNIWEVYKYALDDGDNEVLLCCREYFENSVSNVRGALQSKDFPHIQYEVLLEVMHINDKVDKESGSGFNPGISISEIELFKACNRWAEAECKRQKIEVNGSNKRKVLGECLSLIRFPTMLYKDLLTVVYPEGILTQAGMVNLGRYMDRDPGSHCQVDFPSIRRQFTVTPSDLSSSGSINRSTLYVESEVRVLLTRVWRICKGSYTVTVRDESSKRVWSMFYDTKHRNHVTGGRDNVLHYIDIEPQVLEAGTRYSVTNEWTESGTTTYRQLGVDYITIQARCSGYKGVKVTRERNGTSSLYALMLCLI